VADGISGLQILDITDPTAPTHAGGYSTPGYARAVALAGDYAYVAISGSGLRVFDVSDPSVPVWAGDYGTSGVAHSVAIAGDYAYVADEGAGLHVFDISDPTALVDAGSYDTSGAAYGIAIAGDYAYVADDSAGLQVVRVRQRTMDTSANVAQSVNVDPSEEEVVRAKLSSTQTDSINWELSADGGSTWDAVVPGGDWHGFPLASDDLRWRSSHFYAGGQVNPTCTNLTIDLLYRFPIISSVVDVSNDQGRQVRVSWTRSGHDFAGDTTAVTEYAVFRRIDDDRAVASGAAQSELGARMSGLTPEDTTGPALYPPGSWDFVTTVPAFAEEEYSVVVPTLEDSTITGGMHYSIFFVRAATSDPGVYFDAPPDSGYSVDNLAPAVPRGLSVDYSATENQLAWEESDDADFQYFRVYRGTDPDFVPGAGNLVHVTIGTEWVDSVVEGWQYHYKVTALDFSGNESEPASPGSITGVDEPETPERFALHRNVPNPLRSGTEIAYDVPVDGGEVRLTVYDVAGRRVRVLVDGPQMAGRKSATWDGRDDRGNAVGSGVYYCQLKAPGFEESIKMTVLR
jgi:hypothetical protein